MITVSSRYTQYVLSCHTMQRCLILGTKGCYCRIPAKSSVQRCRAPRARAASKKEKPTWGSLAIILSPICNQRKLTGASASRRCATADERSGRNDKAQQNIQSDEYMRPFDDDRKKNLQGRGLPSHISCLFLDNGGCMLASVWAAVPKPTVPALPGSSFCNLVHELACVVNHMEAPFGGSVWRLLLL